MRYCSYKKNRFKDFFSEDNRHWIKKTVTLKVKRERCLRVTLNDISYIKTYIISDISNQTKKFYKSNSFFLMKWTGAAIDKPIVYSMTNNLNTNGMITIWIAFKWCKIYIYFFLNYSDTGWFTRYIVSSQCV